MNGEYKFLDIPKDAGASAINDAGQIVGTRWIYDEDGISSVGFLLEYDSLDSISVSVDELERKYYLYEPYDPGNHEVPEPSVLWMSGMGIAAICAKLRKKNGVQAI